MATPNLDTLILQARAALKDQHDLLLGTQITSASQDGRRWTLTDLVNLLIVPSINSIIQGVYDNLQTVPLHQRGVALSMVFPRLLKEELRSAKALTGILYDDEAVCQVDLPADFGWLVSSIFIRNAQGQGKAKLRIVDALTFDSTLEHRITERRSPSVLQNGNVLYIFSGDEVDTNTNQIVTRYIQRQQPVVQGTGADILFPETMTALLLQQIRVLADALK